MTDFKDFPLMRSGLEVLTVVVDRLMAAYPNLKGSWGLRPRTARRGDRADIDQLHY